MRLTLGSEIAGRYEVIRLVRRCRYGEVYDAVDHETDGLVRLRLATTSWASPFDRVRSMDRAQLRGMSHPGIACVEDVGEHQGHVFVVSQHVDGRTLKDVIDTDAPLSSVQVITIAEQLAAALVDARANEIRHGNLVPEAIVKDRKGRWIIGDWGAHVVERPAGGYTRYTSFDVMRGDRVAARGQVAFGTEDAYALGVMLYELLTGTPLNDGVGDDELEAALRDEQPWDVSATEAWADVLGNLLTKDPMHRGAVRELARQLESLRPGPAIHIADEPLSAEEHAALVKAAQTRHRRAQRFVVLPKGSGAHAFEMQTDQTVHVVDLGLSDESHDPSGAFGAAHFRSRVSVDGQRVAVLRGRAPSWNAKSGTPIALFDLDADASPRDLFPPVNTGHAVFLCGDFVFVGGTPPHYARLTDDPANMVWRPLHYPDDPKLRKPIDYWGMSGTTLWAVDDMRYPLYALSYDLTDAGFADKPGLHHLGTSQTVTDFACNDHALVYILSAYSGYTHAATQRCVVWDGAGHQIGGVPTGEQFQSQHPPPNAALYAVGVIGAAVVVAFGSKGIGIARLPDTPEPGFAQKLANMIRRTGPQIPALEWQWHDVDGHVVDVVTVEEPRRIYAIVGEDDRRTWRRLEPNTGAIVEQQELSSLRVNSPPPSPVGEWDGVADTNPGSRIVSYTLQRAARDRDVDALTMTHPSQIQLIGFGYRNPSIAWFDIRPGDDGVRVSLVTTGGNEVRRNATFTSVEWCDWVAGLLVELAQPIDKGQPGRGCELNLTLRLRADTLFVTRASGQYSDLLVRACEHIFALMRRLGVEPDADLHPSDGGHTRTT